MGRRAQNSICRRIRCSQKFAAFPMLKIDGWAGSRQSRRSAHALPSRTLPSHALLTSDSTIERRTRVCNAQTLSRTAVVACIASRTLYRQT